ncbi:MAG: hypothetical protein JJU37_04395 [Balneolaceae bacterium]|nr:hypothetical protein [Balneolaceae bacterium]
MKTKLTLRLDESLIADAKEYAGKKGVSLSSLVADYFAAIRDNETKKPDKTELPPITLSLSGILKKSDIDEDDYKIYLEKKHVG